MTPLHQVVPLIVGIHDIGAVADGQGPQALARRRGGRSRDVRYDCDASGIEVEQSRYGPATIQWSEVHAVITAGLTDELAPKRPGPGGGCTGRPPANGSSPGGLVERPDSVARARAAAHRVRYDRAAAAVRVVTAEVIERGLATGHVQQTLFPPAVSADQHKALDCLSRLASPAPGPTGHAPTRQEIR